MKTIINIILLLSSLAFAQKVQYSPLNKLFEKNGLEIYFIYYSEGNGIKDNGVVIYLANNNDYSIKYNFKLIFRADKIDKSTIVKGKLNANEKRTGSNEGLYFIPYEDKRSLTEVGISAVKVERE